VIFLCDEKDYIVKVYEMTPQVTHWIVRGATSEEDAIQKYREGLADWINTYTDYPDCEEVSIEAEED
jgi:hypothetical protein